MSKRLGCLETAEKSLKKSEEKLRDTERRYRLLAENAADVIWTVDLNMRPTYISPSITQLLGYTVEEAMCKRMEEVFTDMSFRNAMTLLEEEFALEKREQKDLSRSQTLTLELICKDGSRVPVEIVYSFVRAAGLVHDIGKINVPSEILSKPSQLNNAEFTLIRSHPKVGYDILKQIEFTWPVADIVLQHHERMNGTGYPSGLTGKSILGEAKILAVADVVEATASHRPYREGPGINKALKEKSRARGLLYDSNVVDRCLALFQNKHFKF